RSNLYGGLRASARSKIDRNPLPRMSQVCILLRLRGVDQKEPQDHSDWVRAASGSMRAVLSRTMSSVARSIRRFVGDSPRDIDNTISVAIAAISRSGWRTVVIGGSVHSMTGRSSYPTTER